MLRMLLATVLLSLGVAAQAASELRVCTPFLPNNFEVTYSHGQASHQLLKKSLYNNLVKWDEVHNTVVPDLATEWTVNSDSTIYRFKLRKGVQFHRTPWFSPSRDFSAQDVLYTFKQLVLNPVLAEHWPYFVSIISSVHAYGDWVQFSLKRRALNFIDNLTDTGAVIMSEEYSRASVMGLGMQLPVGTGPFMLSSFDDVQQTLVRSPRYWQTVETDAVVINLVKTDEQRYGQLRTGQCDLDVEVDGPLIEALVALTDISVARTSRSVLWYLALDTRWPLLKDLRVRQAIAASVDKKRVARLVYGREEFAAVELLMPNDDVDAKHVDKYNIVLARKTIESTERKHFIITKYTRSDRRNDSHLDSILHEAFENLEVSFEVKNYSSMKTFEALDGAHSYSSVNRATVTSSSFGTSLRSSNLVNLLVRCNDNVPGEFNISYYCSEPLSELVRAYDLSADSTEQQQALRRLANEVNRLKLYIPLVHPGEYVHAWRNNVSGIARDAVGVWDFSQVVVH